VPFTLKLSLSAGWSFARLHRSSPRLQQTRPAGGAEVDPRCCRRARRLVLVVLVSAATGGPIARSPQTRTASRPGRASQERPAWLFCLSRSHSTSQARVISALRALPEIDTTRCTGCGWCVSACDLHLLSLERQGWYKFSTLHDSDRCTGCGECESTCPFNVIAMRETAAPCGGTVCGAAVMTVPPLRDSGGLQP